MYNKRWFKWLAIIVLLGVVVFAGAATVAGVSSGAPSPTLSNCQEAIRHGSGTVLPGGLSDREICNRLPQMEGSSSSGAGLLAAIASRRRFTVNLPAWGDAGASRPQAAAPYITSGDDWMDAGATRPQAASVYYTPGDGWWMDAGTSQR